MASFDVWAPNATEVSLLLDGRKVEMRPSAEGRWVTETDAAPDADYAYLLDGDPQPLPDPAARRLPHGVHGAARRYDQSAFDWSDAGWAGIDLTRAVIYELHVGTFTPVGTFDGAIQRLDHLVELGVTHVELMPVNAVNGVWNWGYDGVGWYAVHEPLGGPDGLKRFVDAAHGHGLAVLLDVVYNHLGPSGNYLPRFGPYLKPGRNTWGDLVNLEAVPVRRFILDNALMWLTDYHLDGLRLDAVHALHDTSEVHILKQLAIEVEALAATQGRPLSLIAESDLNDAKLVTPRAEGGYGLSAQWDDDVHHALHATLTGERQGYYCDFGTLAALAKVMTSAFVHDGTYSTFRDRAHGYPVDRSAVPGHRFVVCLQNHDQVGNRATGDRLSELASPARQAVGAVLLFTAPFTPMIWMGEEWAASTRWPFFTSHPEPELAVATGEGRLAEFNRHGWDVTQMIDPQDDRAYRQSILRWDERSEHPHAETLDLYRRLIALRAAESELADDRLADVRVDFHERDGWLVMHRGTLRVVVNLGEQQTVPGAYASEILLATGPAEPSVGGLRMAADTAAIIRT